MTPEAAQGRWRASEVVLLLYVLALFTVSGDPVWTQLENAFGYLLVIVVGGSVLADSRWTLTWPREFALVLVFVAWGVLATLAATGSGVESRFLTAQMIRLWTFLQVVVLGFLTLQVLARSGRFRSIELGFHGGIMLTLLLLTIAVASGELTGRFGSGLGQANDLGLALGVASALCTVQIMRSVSRSSLEGGYPGLHVMGLVLLQLATVLLNLVATGSRQGVLTSGAALLATLAYLGWHLVRRQSRRAFWGSVCAMAVAAAVAPRVAESPLVARLQNVVRFVTGRELVSPERSLADRWSLVQEGFALWQVRPVTGWGFDAFQFVSPRRTYTHSNPVEILANTGMVGVILFYGVLGFIAVRGWRALRRGSVPGWAAGGALFLAGILALNGVGAVTYYNKTHWLLFGYTLALLVPARSAPEVATGVRADGAPEPGQSLSPMATEAECSDGAWTPVSSDS